MKVEDFPDTPAIQFLREHHVHYTPYVFHYEEKGGTKVSSRELQVEEHRIIKTLIMEIDHKHPIIVLMHGNKKVSTKELARILGVKTVSPCRPAVADQHSGYLVGGTSPFGTRKKMPVYLQKTILDLDQIYINGGAKGFLVAIHPQDLVRVLNPHLVDVAKDHDHSAK